MTARHVIEWECDRCGRKRSTSGTRPEGWLVAEVEQVREIHLCVPCVKSLDLFLDGLDLEEIAEREAPEPALLRDRIYLDLHGAREKLCHAQTFLTDRAHRGLLDTAVASIDAVGSKVCRDQWSRFDRDHEIDKCTCDRKGPDDVVRHPSCPVHGLNAVFDR